MAGDNKILTVSFGTFSCTVEGFDDPLGTMREITEYFRDLSAEDRYFGAEPLTPEPERVPMLADRRARSEAAPRPAVSPAPAAIDDADEMNDDTLPPPAAEAAAPPVASAPVPPAPAVQPAAAKAPVERATAAAPRADTAAERLARIRAAARAELAATQASADEDEEEDALEPGLSLPTAPAAPEAGPSVAETLAADETPPNEPIQDETAAPELSAQIAEAIARNALPDEAAPEAPAEGTAATEKPGPGAAVFEENPIDAGGGTADRIFREAGHALEDIEARRRHSAIAHLKAAVSATVNDRNILGWRKRQHEEEEVAYRADLAQVVKPERTERAPEPSIAEPAVPDLPEETAEEDDFAGVEMSQPFVLGVEARVDPNSLAALALTEDDRILEEETRPVRPRSSNETFSQFAERVGAHDLSELLEAAAAYSAQVEGRPQFSRPQIMKHVVAATDEDYSREDGLRSFGALLRQGKIQKLKRGIFVLSDNSRFAPRSRLAGE